MKLDRLTCSVVGQGHAAACKLPVADGSTERNSGRSGAHVAVESNAGAERQLPRTANGSSKP